LMVPRASGCCIEGSALGHACVPSACSTVVLRALVARTPPPAWIRDACPCGLQWPCRGGGVDGRCRATPACTCMKL
jgi:hypothetical protein